MIDLAGGVQVVYQHGAIFISSAGNAGPALSTVGAAGGTSSAIVGIGAYVSPELASAGHALREALPQVKSEHGTHLVQSQHCMQICLHARLHARLWQCCLLCCFQVQLLSNYLCLLACELIRSLPTFLPIAAPEGHGLQSANKNTKVLARPLDSSLTYAGSSVQFYK